MNETNIFMKPEHNKRILGVDALRVISMLMVLTLHVLGTGGILNTAVSKKYWAVWFLEIAAFCAVNCYALISGYVGVYSKYRFSNLAELWCRVAWYNIPVFFLFYFFKSEVIGQNDMISVFFPILSNQYWYFTAYSFMFLFIPILNQGLNSLSKNQLRVILIGIVTATSLCHPLILIYWKDWFCLNDGYSPLWLMILYLIGGYIRKYGLFNKIRTYRALKMFSMYFAFVSITWLYKFIIEKCFKENSEMLIHNKMFLHYQSITVVAAAVFLFLAFEKISFPSALGKVIGFFAPLSFSVYLIHMQPQIKVNILTNGFIWVTEMSGYKMIPTILCIIIGIFIICSLVDLIRFYFWKLIKLKQKLNNLESGIKDIICRYCD